MLPGWVLSGQLLRRVAEPPSEPDEPFQATTTDASDEVIVYLWQATPIVIDFATSAAVDQDAGVHRGTTSRADRRGRRRRTEPRPNPGGWLDTRNQRHMVGVPQRATPHHAPGGLP